MVLRLKTKYIVTVTAVCCVSAAGQYCPPLLIFPRARMKAELLDKAPVGAVGVANKSGWINKLTFLQWFDHFLGYFQPKHRSSPSLLIMDGHASHISLGLVNKARDNNVSLLILPSHCTHKVQPLDVAVFKRFKSHYDRAVMNWLHAHPGRAVQESNVAELFSEAWGKAATVANAVSGFAKARINPFKESDTDDEECIAADVTDMPLEAQQHGDGSASAVGASSSSLIHEESTTQLTADVGEPPATASLDIAFETSNQPSAAIEEPSPVEPSVQVINQPPSVQSLGKSTGMDANEPSSAALEMAVETTQVEEPTASMLELTVEVVNEPLLMRPLEKSSMAVAANKSLPPLLEITAEMSDQLPAEQLTEVTVGDVDTLPQATHCVLSMEKSVVSADIGEPSPSKPTVNVTTGISRTFRQFIPVP